MTPEENLTNQFKQSVKKNHDRIKNLLTEAVKVVSDLTTPQESRLENLQRYLFEAKRVSHSLNDILPQPPSWLSALTDIPEDSQFKQYTHKWLIRLLSLHQQIIHHDWKFDPNPEDIAINLDKIYAECRDRSQLPVLLDRLIENLEKILTHEELDRTSIKEALERLIATIHVSKKGSYFSLRGTWNLLIHFFKNYAIALLEDIPMIGPLVAAVKTTMDDLQKEIKNVDVQVREKVDSITMKTPKSLYGKQGPLLELPTATIDLQC